MGFQIDDKKLKRAGLDYWHMLDITMYSSLSDFFEKKILADQTGYYFSTKAQHTHTEVIYPDNCYLFLEKKPPVCQNHFYMNIPDTTVRIPMITQARSLNLSNAIAIAAYEVLRQWDYPALSCEGQLREFQW